MKKYPILAGLIILLVILAGFWYLKSSTNTPSDLKTYRNDNYGFEFKYLNDSKNNLQVQEFGQSRNTIPRENQFCLIGTNQDYKKSVCITIYKPETNATLVFPYQTTNDQKIDLLEVKNFFIGKTRATKALWLTSLGISNYGFYLKNEEYLYVVTTAFSGNNYKSSRILDDFEVISKTFRLTK